MHRPNLARLGWLPCLFLVACPAPAMDPDAPATDVAAHDAPVDAAPDAHDLMPDALVRDARPLGAPDVRLDAGLEDAAPLFDVGRDAGVDAMFDAGSDGGRDAGVDARADAYDPCTRCGANASCVDAECVCDLGFVGTGATCVADTEGLDGLEAYLKASNTSPESGFVLGDEFGAAVAISSDGTTLAVGARNEDDAAPNAGAVYVYRRTGRVWRVEALVRARSASMGDEFGTALALSADGSVLAVGAPLEAGSGSGVDAPIDELSAESGAVFVFRRSGTVWAQEAYVKASSPGAGDRFGTSVALSALGDVLVVSAPREDGSGSGVGAAPNEGAPDAGAVYVLRRTGSGWSHEVTLKAHNTGAGDEFGATVAMSADASVVAVGAPREAGSGGGVNPPSNEFGTGVGALYVYRRSGSVWLFDAYIKPRRGASGHLTFSFPGALALSSDGSTLVAGDPLSTVPDAAGRVRFNMGFVHVFRHGGSWVEEARVTAPNGAADHFFGRSVAVSADGSVLAAGAEMESGSGVGVDPPWGEGVLRSGAAYTMVRSGSTWSPDAYVKAPWTSPDDRFGTSVALSGDGSSLVVGAPLEDGSGRGVDPPVDERAVNSGAVYVFR